MVMGQETKVLFTLETHSISNSLAPAESTIIGVGMVAVAWPPGSDGTKSFDMQDAVLLVGREVKGLVDEYALLCSVWECLQETKQYSKIVRNLQWVMEMLYIRTAVQLTRVPGVIPQHEMLVEDLYAYHTRYNPHSLEELYYLVCGKYILQDARAKNSVEVRLRRKLHLLDYFYRRLGGA